MFSSDSSFPEMLQSLATMKMKHLIFLLPCCFFLLILKHFVTKFKLLRNLEFLDSMLGCTNDATEIKFKVCGG